MLRLVPSYTPALTADRWTVMVVERDPMLRDLMRRILEKQDVEVLVAADGWTALGLAEGQAEGIDLLLTDVVVSGVDGFELTERIRAIHPAVRVLFLTGDADASTYVSTGLQASGQPTLARPFTQSALLSQIHHVLATPVPSLDFPAHHPPLSGMRLA